MNEREQIVNDMPEHQFGSSSSIGGFGEPRRDSFGRYKGFYERVVNTPTLAMDFLAQFAGGVIRLSRDEGYTRLQHRAVIEGDILRSITPDIGGWLEAIVPLDAGSHGSEPYLVYFGQNTQQRSQHKDDLSRLRQNVESASSVRVRVARAVLERLGQGGYDVAILSMDERENTTVQEQIAGLYRRFGWERDDVNKMLANQHNILSVVVHEGRIISSGIAEMAIVPIEGHPLRIVELTEAATLSEHEGNGCFAAISRTLLMELARRSRAHDILGGELDLAFGESNGLSEGILRIAASQGRTFSTDTTTRFGFDNAGILRQQVPISGPARNTAYNDLVVTSLTRSQVYALE